MLIIGGNIDFVTRKQHVILYRPDGSVTTREMLCSCNVCLKGDIDLCEEFHVNISEALMVDECQDEFRDGMRENLVVEGAFVGFVAVRASEKALTPYYIYEVLEVFTERKSFKGLWYCPQGDTTKLKKTKTVEEVFMNCVFSADINITKGKDRYFVIDRELDAELCYYSR